MRGRANLPTSSLTPPVQQRQSNYPKSIFGSIPAVKYRKNSLRLLIFLSSASTGSVENFCRLLDPLYRIHPAHVQDTSDRWQVPFARLRRRAGGTRQSRTETDGHHPCKRCAKPTAEIQSRARGSVTDCKTPVVAGDLLST